LVSVNSIAKSAGIDSMKKDFFELTLEAGSDYLSKQINLQ
tara:strand:+ start:142 stop:261 length:120 start_codon:yes stop_codon:yes gene_type:complete